MKFTVPTAVSTRFAKQGLILQKNSPKILFAGGIVLMGATVVSACRGTLQLTDLLDEVRKDREDLKFLVDTKDVSDREYKKLNTYITARGYARVVRLYLPAISLGVAAVACLTTSHNQLNRRNAGLSAALAATERALDSYRGRVREAYGDERELEIWREEKTEMVAVTDDEGRATKSTQKLKTGGGHSPYARIWGRDTTNEWNPQAEYNLAKLRSVQELGTLWLNSRGHVFLNEIHDELGLSRTAAGAVVGWLSVKEGGTDGYVDFGVLAPGEEVRFLDFLRGTEDHVMLDFNVDGEIFRSL